MNQSSHSRPILPTYNQALGIGLGSQSVLRLPEYKQSYLARYTPYCRYTSHPRFFCDDNVPDYNEALTTSPPSRRAQNFQSAPQPQPYIDPGKAERDKSALNDFFDWLSTLFVAPGEQGADTKEGSGGTDEVKKIEN